MIRSDLTKKRYYSHSRSKPRRKSIAIDKNNVFFITMIACVILGVISGIIKANFMSDSEFVRLSQNLNVYLNDFNMSSINKAEAFVECFVKYGKILIIIWFLAFLPPAAYGSYILVFIKGMSLGFSTAILIKIFGADGIYLSFVLYVPQNLVLLPAYMFAAFSALRFSKLYMGSFAIGGKTKPAPTVLPIGAVLEYVTALMLGLAGVILSVLLETYIAPQLLRFFTK